MFFRRIMFSAVIIGMLTGLLLSATQVIGVTPILLDAEVYEVAGEPAQIMPGHMDAGSHHSDEAWGPEDGVERVGYTVLANVLAAIGFACMLLVVMSQFESRGLVKLTKLQGILWGLAGYFIFFVVPGVGLPPEVPGSSADLLEHRQSWWLLAVCGAAISLVTFVFAPVKFKLFGLLSLALPFVVGAPHIDGPLFSNPDAHAVMALTELHQQFIVATTVSNFIFWIALGMSCAWMLKSSLHARL